MNKEQIYQGGGIIERGDVSGPQPSGSASSSCNDTLAFQSVTLLAQPTKADWENHRPIITRLYFEEERSMNDVRTIMECKFGFRAT